MRRVLSVLAFLILAILGVGCGSTGQQEIAYPILALGQPQTTFMAGDWQVTLEVARIGFGPAYFCATEAASADLCPAAVAEFAASGEVDGLAGAPRQLGSVTGVTGAIRSVTFDYAISWFGTHQDPTPTHGAPGAHSTHFEGRALRGATAFRFVADIDVVPPNQGSYAVRGARVRADIQNPTVRLVVSFDPVAWWRQVDFDDLARLGGNPIVIASGSRSYNAIVAAMTAGSLPSFSWSQQ